jgi:hypothetical protein
MFGMTCFVRHYLSTTERYIPILISPPMMSSMASGIGARFIRFWDGLSLSDVGDPDGVMNRVAELLRSTVEDIVGFITRSASEFLAMIKRVMMEKQ